MEFGAKPLRTAGQESRAKHKRKKAARERKRKEKKGTKTREKEEKICGGEAVDKHKAPVSKKSYIAWRQAMDRQGRKDCLFLCSAEKKL